MFISTFLALLMVPTSASAADVVITKAKFVEEFKAGLPAALCGEKTFFRVCFDTTEDACKKAIAAAGATCMAELEKEIPEKLHQPADGQAAGKKIGSCAGKKYATDLDQKKKNSPECNDPAKWQ